MKKKLLTFSFLIFIPFISFASAESFTGKSLLDIFFSNKDQEAAVLDSSIYTLRNLKLDTKGKTLSLLDPDIKNVATLSESSLLGLRVKDWKVNYEAKGHSRGICEPPMLNLSFDKTDSKGKPKELFIGASTYNGDASLQYQKIRLIPECDVWNEYYEGGGSSGFNGQITANFREFVVHKIFREFGIPTADVIGFTNLTFVSPEAKYNGKTFKYMIIQRPGELDDQIPFMKQFNLSGIPYESGDGSDYHLNYGDSFDELLGGQIYDQSGKSVKLDFDPNTTTRFFLLTDFLDVGDMGFLHNEDGGIDATTGLVKRIPHGFDASMDCQMNDINRDTVTYRINGIKDESVKQKYRDIYYKNAKEIFGNKENLNRMIKLVNTFPYPEANKAKVREFLRIRFYQYMKYFNSADFAEAMNRQYRPSKILMPFVSNDEYETHRVAFIKGCERPTVPLAGVSLKVIGEPKLYKYTYTDGDVRVKAAFRVTIQTTDHALKVSKNNPFELRLVKVGQNDLEEKSVYTNPLLETVSGVDDVAGPYYIIPPHTLTTFNLARSFGENEILKGKYYVELNSFHPNNNITPLDISLKTNTLAMGLVEPITLKSPKQNEKLTAGLKYIISWNAAPNRYTGFRLYDSHNRGYDLLNPDEP